jgi:Ca2+-binding EF-hand superfamily protein
MLLAFGAASAAVDAIKSLTSKPSSSQPIGFGPAPGSPFDISAPPSGGSTAVPGFSGGAQISPVTLSALLAAQSQSSTAGAAPAATNPGSALKDLFSQIDANGDGQITKSEFESALGAGGTNIAAADKVFNELDSNGDGSVSLGELKSALKGGHHGGHHHLHATNSTGSTDADGGTTNGNTNGSVSPDPLLQALAASSATTTSSTSKNGATGLSSLLTPVYSSQLTPISLSAASYARLEQLIHNGPQFSSSTTPLSLSA